jgi:tetratricopeptide (TPR) repeat protein
MRLLRCRALGSVVVIGLALALARTAFADDIDICHDSSGDLAIAACTRAIESGRLSKQNLAVAYTSRGVEWRAKGDIDRAIIDHTDAIRVDPSEALAFFNRGNAYKRKGQYDRAIKEYDQAIRLNPNDSLAINNRAAAIKEKNK